MLFARGLGAFPSGVFTLPGQTSTASTGAPTSHDNRLTRAGINELVRRLDVDLQNRYLAAKAAMADTLTAQKAGSCNSRMLCTIWGGVGPKIFGRNVSASDLPKYLIMYPVGTFIVLGVPYNERAVWDQIQNHVISSPFVPTDETKLRVVQQLIAQLDHDFGQPTDDNSPVIQIMKKFPQFSLLDEGTGIAPPYPTDDEFNNSHGLQKFYARGGWFHNQDYTHARKPFYRTYRTWGQSYCFCGTAPAMNLINTAGSTEWNVKLSMTPQQWAFVMEPVDVGAFQKTLGAIATVMKALDQVICAAVGANQLPVVEKSVTGEQCVDAVTGKSCKKGSAASCICTSPTDAQKASMGAFNFVAQQICARQDFSTPPIVQPPGTAPTIFAPPSTPFPWWLIVLAGGVGGAVLFARKRT